MHTITVPPLPHVSVLAAADANIHADVLALLFERSDALIDLVVPVVIGKNFSSYAEYIEVVQERLLGLLGGDTAKPTPEQLQLLDTILQAHPRLGARSGVANDGSKLSAASSSEQRSLAVGEQDGESGELQRLNEEYEQVFPSLRYVVFVNGRPRKVIMDDMRRRIARADLAAERLQSIEAMCDIARDRVKKFS